MIFDRWSIVTSPIQRDSEQHHTRQEDAVVDDLREEELLRIL